MDAEVPKYVDDGALREQDAVPLLNFLMRHDRAQPTGRGQPFFSGREAEINAFRSSATGLMLGEQANATVVVEGPPGVGKSALLAQFQEEMRHLPPVGPNRRRWLPVPIRGSRAESPGAIREAVDEAIARQLAQDVLASEAGVSDQRATARFLAILGGEAALRKKGFEARAAARDGLQRGFGVLGFKLGGGSRNVVENIEAVYGRRAPEWGAWQVVLLIDEAQRISDQAPGCAKGTLEALHLGFMRAPISCCAFGLPGTADALERARVSRTTVAYDLRLGSLDDRASRMVVRRCFAQYGVTHGKAWEAAILARSANWPQHLASYLNAALKVLQAKAEGPEAMGDARRSSLVSATDAGDANRVSYYARRMERLQRSSPWYAHYAKELVSWMARDGNGPPDRNQSEVLGFLQAPPLKLTKDEVIRFIDAARHSGLLERLPNGRIHLPIPSLAGHLLEETLPLIPNEP